MRYDFVFVAVPSFSPTARQIIKRYFITQPAFLDNGFVQKGKLTDKDIERFLRRVRREHALIAVLPDYYANEWYNITRNYYWLLWLAPVHTKEEFKIAYTLPENAIPAFPVGKNEDYTLSEFMDYFDKVWILGLKESLFSLLIQYRRKIAGFDTTVPVLYAMKYGKLWYAPNRSEKPRKRLPWVRLLEHNCKMLRRYLMFKGFFPVKLD